MKQIDEYMQSRVDSVDFDFDESYWLQAEVLIKAQQEKKRKRRIIIFFLSLLVLLVCAINTVLYLSSTQIKNPQNSIATNEKLLSKKTVKNAVVNSRINPVTNQVKNITAKKSKPSKKLKFRADSQYKSSSIDIVQLDTNINIEDSLLHMDLLKFEILAPKSFNEIFEKSDYVDQVRYKNRWRGLMEVGMTDTRSLNTGYFVNIQLLAELNKKHSVSSGVGFKSINNEFLKYTFENIDYSFGEIRSTTQVITDRLYYLELPIQYRYQFYKRNVFKLGLTANYLFAQRESIKKLGESESEIEIRRGSSSDFGQYDLQASIGYENSLFRRYRVGLSYQLGLFSNINAIKKQRLVNDHFNSEIRIYVLMNLLK